MLSRSKSKSKNCTNHLKTPQQQHWSSFSCWIGCSTAGMCSSSSNMTFNFSGTDASFLISFTGSSLGTKRCEARRDVNRSACIMFWLCFRHGTNIDDFRRVFAGAVEIGSLKISNELPRWTDPTEPLSNQRNGFPIWICGSDTSTAWLWLINPSSSFWGIGQSVRFEKFRAIAAWSNNLLVNGCRWIIWSKP